MTIAEAKKVIYSEPNAPIGRLWFATCVFATKHKAKSLKCADMVECLRRGNRIGEYSTISEYAAIALYARTKRKRRSRVPYEDFDTNPESWEAYLKAHKLV